MEATFEAARKRMVEEQILRRGIGAERVLAAFVEVPRELFVSADLRENAYEDRALPIASGQTISQPYVVAAMIDTADIGPGDTVLEVGGLWLCSGGDQPDCRAGDCDRVRGIARGYGERAACGPGIHQCRNQLRGWPPRLPSGRTFRFHSGFGCCARCAGGAQAAIGNRWQACHAGRRYRVSNHGADRAVCNRPVHPDQARPGPVRSLAAEGKRRTDFGINCARTSTARLPHPSNSAAGNIPSACFVDQRNRHAGSLT